jgi:multicomponent Na+:H+ antiporter subunit C
MILIVSLAVAILFGSGAYLLLKPDLIRVVAGMVLISNAANLFIMSAGLTKGVPPIYPLPAGKQIADPLVQAMTLTAVVISFGVTALLLSIVYRVYVAHRSIDIEELAEAEEQHAATEEEALPETMEEKTEPSSEEEEALVGRAD